MKWFSLYFFSLMCLCATAQVPQSFSYQAVCRNTNGSPLLNQPIHFNIELLQGSITGTVVYAETQRDTTSAFGVSMLEIGRGTPTTGTFAGINWANTPTFIRISFDATGGNNFIPLGTHELLSVPYALYSGNGLPNGTSPSQLLYWNGNSWVQLAPGNSGESLTLCGNVLTWATGGVCPGVVSTLSCATAVNAGNLCQGVVASGVSSTISYTAINGGPHNGQIISSTGVAGLTATLSAGTFANGNGTVVYTISGTPSASGTASFAINIGGQSCTLTRTVDAGLITGLSCSTAINIGNLVQGVSASGVNSAISYTGGNGGPHNGQIVSSTGVTGLTAMLSAGIFASGNDTVVYTISGTPSASGTASFVINIGGQSCTLNRTISGPLGSWRPGMVHCGTPTAVIPVTNPATNKTWMDRNLGAFQVATSSTDANAYGDLYQWGRFGDGHQCRNSGTTSTLSTTDTVGNGIFILTNDDWRSTQNDNLWQGVNGINNPCPTGYRLPTEAELDSERLSWISNDVAGALASPLKLPLGGWRSCYNGNPTNVVSYARYCTSTVSATFARTLTFRNSFNASLETMLRGDGHSVRCLQD